jgi:penicillin-binding protein 1C
MQVVRLSRKGKARTIKEKLIEAVLAFRLELATSKKKILLAYSANAPFGGNVVGLEAASWRYFGRAPVNLSWAETATLAVLPNAPSLIYPGKNQIKLQQKRDRLLQRLLQKRILDSLDYELACKEPLPKKPYRLPDFATHLLMRTVKESPGNRVRTTVKTALQKKVADIVSRHNKNLVFNEIHNLGVLVLDTKSGKVLAYIGNTNSIGADEHANQVDMITSPRSSGSILKPFLYAAMLNSGDILPHTLVRDYPINFSGYTPKNYSLEYDGAVYASKALQRSLNIPAVLMLQEYGVERFWHLLRDLGLTTFTRDPVNYGLSLILGGGEVSLWELCGGYASLGRVLLHNPDNDSDNKGNYFEPVYNENNRNIDKTEPIRNDLLDAASIWWMFDVLQEVNRPETQSGWRSFLSSRQISWKTGTSFGFKDAWAVGITPGYVVGVWAGNADGEGRPGLTGTSVAAPVLFDVFSILESSGNFEEPLDELFPAVICKKSGHIASPICDETDTIYVPEVCLETQPCPYHSMVHLDGSMNWRVSSACCSPNNMVHKPWFILPPVMEYFYAKKNQLYQYLPAWRADCNEAKENPMEFVFPVFGTKLYVPIELDEKRGEAVFRIAHRKDDVTLYWHLDKEYLGTTKHIHEFGIQPDAGKHRITVVDDNGNVLERDIEVLGK